MFFTLFLFSPVLDKKTTISKLFAWSPFPRSPFFNVDGLSGVDWGRIKKQSFLHSVCRTTYSQHWRRGNGGKATKRPTLKSPFFYPTPGRNRKLTGRVWNKNSAIHWYTEGETCTNAVPEYIDLVHVSLKGLSLCFPWATWSEKYRQNMKSKLLPNAKSETSTNAVLES